MALRGEKRKRDIESSSKEHKKTTKVKRKAEFNSIPLDSLSWSKVPFPERFEDAEGFLELEEISDVDVVRDEQAGKVQFKVSDKKRRKHSTNANVDSEHGSTEKIAGQPEQSSDREDEWSGFEDPPTSSEQDQPLSKINTAVPTKKKALKEAKGQKVHQKGTEESAQLEIDRDAGENPFSALISEDPNENVATSDWDDLDLNPTTISSLARLGFSSPTPIQRKAIPLIRKGHDVIGKASTGSGKTLAFGIPIYEHVLQSRLSEAQSKITSPTALILSPTRELAHQLSEHINNLALSDLVIATLTGGLSVHKQRRLLADADIVVATPGRLWEVLSGEQDILNKLKAAPFLVLDEADRLLSDGHFKEVEEILNALDRANDQDEEDDSKHPEEIETSKRQTLVFSATFQKDLQQKLAGKLNSSELLGKQESMEYLLRKIKFREERPQFVDVNPVSQMASNLKEYIVECAGLEKDLYLYSTLLLYPNKRSLIFTNSITSVRRLTPYLENLNLKVHAIHSQMPQKARLRSIERFSAPTAANSLLVATDVAARGLDIPQVDLVLHYHVPRAADMYVHRSGRTARAERSGESVLLCAPEEVQGVRRLVAKVHAQNALDRPPDESGGSNKFFMRTLDLDRRIVAKLKSRVTLSKKIADAGLAKEKKNHEDNWLRNAAEELGVDYDSEEFAAAQGSKKGRGQGRKQREKEARGLSKDQLGVLRAELKEELRKRVNVGVSERYLSASGVDIDELLEGKQGEFLGRVELDHSKR